MVSISSRTAYVLLASIEDEFRSIVEAHVGDAEPEEVLGATLFTRARDRRAKDGVVGQPETLAQLLPYLDFQDSYDLASSIGHRLPIELRTGLKNVAGSVGKVTAARNRVAHNRPLDVDDLPAIVDFVEKLVCLNGWSWSALSATHAELRADPGYIFRTSAQLIVDPDSTVANNLPAPDFDETSLLGRKDERKQLLRALQGAWPVISILGDGGIGKTALALQVCYDLVAMPNCPFEAIVWVTAKNAQLTSTEIVRIESAIEDSLGLFASANEAVGGSGESSEAISELLDVLEIFPTLLVLDNVETVLDENFPVFLRDVPVGSKVLITSRIGVKTENPFRLTGLSVDDSTKLMRIIARSRGIELNSIARQEDLVDWAKRMNCHPAYIKWFMSGLQAGQTPEQLLSDNGLLLEYCMSNVFDYLNDAAKTALRAMLVVPGSHTMAELAFLTDFDSTQIQQAVLDLTTTNFVLQVRGGASGTALELSDFARAYLRRTLEVDGAERSFLTQKQTQLYALGGGLRAAHSLNPFESDTIDIRGVGDYSAARLLREALDEAELGRIDHGLQLCSEAAELAPGYHEASRVEAFLHEQATNFGEAFESYSRAKDQAPEDAYVAYFFGEFMIRSGFNPNYGLRELQRAAKLKPESAFLQLAIANAHVNAGDVESGMQAAAYALRAAEGAERSDAVFVLWRATAFKSHGAADAKDWSSLAEDLEFALEMTENVSDAEMVASLDLLLWLREMAQIGAANSADNFIANRLTALSDVLRSRVVASDPTYDSRVIGVVDSLVDNRGFGFLKAVNGKYFFHATQLWDRRDFSSLQIGSVVAFSPGGQPREGKPEAQSVNWIG